MDSKFFEKKCKNIWSCKKKVVILHEFSRIVGVGVLFWDAKKMEAVWVID